MIMVAISAAFGMRPDATTCPSITSPGVLRTPWATISSIFSTFVIVAGWPVWATAFSTSA